MHQTGHMVACSHLALRSNVSRHDTGLIRMARIGMILLLVLAPVAFAEELSGVVTDRTGAVVTSATVRVRAGEFSAEHTTDASGHFVFLDVPSRAAITVTVRAV